MLMAITDPEAFAILLTILVATASAGRAVIFARLCCMDRRRSSWGRIMLGALSISVLG